MTENHAEYGFELLVTRTAEFSIEEKAAQIQGLINQLSPIIHAAGFEVSVEHIFSFKTKEGGT